MESQLPPRESVELLAEEFVERYRRGERPPISEYTQRHPEHAEQIRELFPALVMMEQIAPDGSELDAEDDAGAKREVHHLRQFGDYRILREVGRGGMGVVYEADQVSLGRHVALKVLSQQMQSDSQQRLRFEREARAAAKLHHTNIVPVFGVGEENGQHYYVMQFIHGLGLDDVIDELRRLLLKNGSPLGSLAMESPVAPRDVPAAAIAKSLVTGDFQSLELSNGHDLGKAITSNDLTADIMLGRSADAPIAGSPQDTSPSTTTPSMVLPGQGKDSLGGRAPTYWHSVANIGLQVAEALLHAHEQGVLHRDIKPSNLLLDMQGNVWVTDFGLAKLEDHQNITHSGDVLGTLRYMAPECFNGQADARSEIYSLGLSLYELLALKPAFGETDRNKLIKQVTTSEAPPLHKSAPGVPRDLATICQKCIEREPACRYQSAKALADDLRCWLNDEPIKARPIGRVEKIARWRRRHPTESGLLAAVVMITVLGFALVLWQWREAETQRQDAVTARKSADEERDNALWLAYKSSIKAAAAALDNQNVVRAEEALHQSPEKNRGWEWRHLHSQLDKSYALLKSGPQWKESDVAFRMAVNPKGNLLATSHRDGSIRLWALPSGKLIKKLPPQKQGSEYWHSAMLFSPDGTRLVSLDGKAFSLWNVGSGERIAALQHPQGITGAYFHPDGQILAIVFADEYPIRLFDGHSGKLLQKVKGELPSQWTKPGREGTGKVFAVQHGNGRQAYLYDIESGQQRPLVIDDPQLCTIAGVAFAPDQTKMVSAGVWPVTSVFLWDVHSGKRLWKADGHENSVTKLVVSPDGSRVVSISSDKTARIWDLKTGKSLAVLRGHSGALVDVAFSPDGSLLFTGAMDKTIRIWDARTGSPLSTLSGHRAGITRLGLVSGGELLLSLDSDGKMLFWNLEFLKRNRHTGHSSFVYDAAFSVDGLRIVSVGWDKTMRLWDVAGGRPLAVADSLPYQGCGVAVHPDGRHMAVLVPGTIFICDALTGQIEHKLKLPGAYEFTAARIKFHPDGTLLAGASSDGHIYLWETKSYQLVKKLVGHKHDEMLIADNILAICFDRAGSHLFAGDFGGRIRLWDIAGGHEVAAWQGHKKLIRALALSPDGKWLVSTSGDETVKIWDAATRKRIATYQFGFQVYDATFHPKENRLALACQDSSIRLWDIEKWEEVAVLEGHEDYVHSVDFSPDGTRLVSGSGDFTVRIWDTVPAKVRAKKWTPIRKQNRRGTWHGRKYIPPKHYLCYRAGKPLIIDGMLEDDAWKAVPWTEDFVDIEGDRKPKPLFKTRAKMLWDDDYFYVAAQLQESHVWGTLTKHDSIIYNDNDFEVFIDPDGDNHKYLEYEINPLATGFDLFMPKPYKDGGRAVIPWNIASLKKAVHINGTLNDPSDTDKSWTVELAFPWKELGKKAEVPFPPKDGDQWRVNFSRVQWKHEVVDGKYRKIKGLPEDNWVWSPQYAINMHRPETWGYVQFSTKPIGKAKFVADPTAKAQFMLHRILYAQRAFRHEHKRWARNFTELGLEKLAPPPGVETPRLNLNGDHFTITTRMKKANGEAVTLIVHQDSRLERRK